MGFLTPRKEYEKYVDISRTKRCKKLWCDIQCQEDFDTGMKYYCDECGASFVLNKAADWTFDKYADAFLNRRKMIQVWMKQEWHDAYWWNNERQERLLTHWFVDKVESEDAPEGFDPSLGSV